MDLDMKGGVPRVVTGVLGLLLKTVEFGQVKEPVSQLFIYKMGIK